MQREPMPEAENYENRKRRQQQHKEPNRVLAYLRRADIVVGYIGGFMVVATVQAVEVVVFTLYALHVHNQGDVALIVTDNTDDDEVEDTCKLWSSQVAKLKQMIGS